MAEQQTQVVDRQRIHRGQPGTDGELSVGDPERHHAILLQPLGGEGLGQPFDVEKLRRAVLILRGWRRRPSRFERGAHRCGGLMTVSGRTGGTLTLIVSDTGLMRGSVGTVCSSSLPFFTASRRRSTSASLKITCGVRKRNSSLAVRLSCLFPNSHPIHGMSLRYGMPERFLVSEWSASPPTTVV